MASRAQRRSRPLLGGDLLNELLEARIGNQSPRVPITLDLGKRISGIRAHLLAVNQGRIVVRRRDVESPYLLPGFARCAVCGGGLGVLSGSHSSARRHLYGCLAFAKRGTSICGNGLRLPIDRVDDAVLKALGGEVLRPAVVMAVLDGVFAELSPTSLTRDRDQQRALLADIEKEIGNLTKAIAATGPLDSLVTELQARERRRAELSATLAASRLLKVEQLDRGAIERRVRVHLDRWRTLLATHVQDGRQLLREASLARSRFTPEGRTYRFEGEVGVGQLIAGMADVAPFMVAVRGIEPRFDG
jgi:Recombinase zinc beta ribbon domain